MFYGIFLAFNSVLDFFLVSAGFFVMLSLFLAGYSHKKYSGKLFYPSMFFVSGIFFFFTTANFLLVKVYMSDPFSFVEPNVFLIASGILAFLASFDMIKVCREKVYD